ncbi:histidine kinase [Algibacter sp. L1A34]|uniref:tetratricopeptide repeat-containing sensor histidine kinase n=1 Tax=Algibacter sp. L1A34 TaxID=2686365 RepID=UPI00131DF5B4|nr:histidine kinase [Algibacter sp. L1A34]
MRIIKTYMGIKTYLKVKIQYLIACFFMLHCATQLSGQNNVEDLFTNREYAKVIEILSEKEAKEPLTLRDYFLLTKSYGRNQQYANGLIYSNEMIGKSLKEKDTTNLIKAFNLKAENLIDSGGYNDGLIFCEKVSPVFREQDSIEFQKLCFKWGMMYYHTDQYQKAYETYNKITLPKYRNLNLFKNNYALTLMGLEKWDEALFYFKKSIKQYKSSNNTERLNFNYSNISVVYMHQGKWEQSKVYLDSAASVLNNDSPLRAKKGIYTNYFKLYQIQGKQDKAARYLELISQVNENIYRAKINEEIDALETSNRREDQLKEKFRASEKQKLWGAIVSLLALIGFISTIFYFKYKNVKAAHEQSVTEQQLLRSQMTPHFIFNSLSVIQGMILNKEDKKAVKYLSKFSKLLRLILESSREKLVVVKEELLAMQSYVELQNLSRLQPFKYSVEIDESINVEEILIPPMLIQPFIENAIEHGFKEQIDNPEIKIHLTSKENVLICTIKDNGIGLNATKSTTKSHKSSLATKITSERLKMLSKNFKIESNLILEDREKYNEKGTQVTLMIPYKIETL